MEIGRFELSRFSHLRIRLLLDVLRKLAVGNLIQKRITRHKGFQFYFLCRVDVYVMYVCKVTRKMSVLL